MARFVSVGWVGDQVYVGVYRDMVGAKEDVACDVIKALFPDEIIKWSKAENKARERESKKRI
jgi:hypothetical protein